MLGRLVALVVLAFSLAVQVFAVTALFDAFELFDTAWREPFYSAGKLYAIGVNLIAEHVGGTTTDLVDRTALAGKLAVPCWWVHVMAMYLAAVLGIWGGSRAFGRRSVEANVFARGGLSLAWPAAFAMLVFDGLRNRRVASFVKHNTTVSWFYGLTVLALYAGANWVNINVLTGTPPAGQEVSLENDVQCPMVRPRDLPEGVAPFVSFVAGS